MMSSILFAVQSTVAKTGTEWNWSGTPVIIGACVLALLIIPRIVRLPHVGQKMPLPFPEVFNNPSVGAFLASMSVGHLIGIPAVLGLTNLGIL
ncbi:MAG: photosystem I reaction center subunit PsaK [Tolypothrix carrinoi HA7290-LM1]|jgi:photosystem I subunit 10|nr:photosystem I reaction center subunit PsaK [Tolypothrix carrinoi HA7290-LM1]